MMKSILDFAEWALLLVTENSGRVDAVRKTTHKEAITLFTLEHINRVATHQTIVVVTTMKEGMHGERRNHNMAGITSWKRIWSNSRCSTNIR